MIEQSVSLASNGVIKVPGYEQLVRFGYTKNRGVYRLAVSATGEWEGLAIRCFWHVPDGKAPASSLVVDGYVAVPASVTAQPGSGCITFEGSDGAKVMTSADLRYRVSANSGTTVTLRAKRAILAPSARSARRVSKALKALKALRVPLAHRARLGRKASRARKALKARPALP